MSESFEIQKPNIEAILKSEPEEILKAQPQEFLISGDTFTVPPDIFLKALRFFNSFPILSSYYLIFFPFKDTLFLFFDNNESQAILSLPLKRSSDFSVEKSYLCDLKQLLLLADNKPFSFLFEDGNVFYKSQLLKSRLNFFKNSHGFTFPPSNVNWLSCAPIIPYLKKLSLVLSLIPKISESYISVTHGKLQASCCLFKISFTVPELLSPTLDPFYLRPSDIKILLNFQGLSKWAIQDNRLYLQSEDNLTWASLPLISTKDSSISLPSENSSQTLAFNPDIFTSIVKKALLLKESEIGFKVTDDFSNLVFKTNQTEFYLPVRPYTAEKFSPCSSMNLKLLNSFSIFLKGHPESYISSTPSTFHYFIPNEVDITLPNL